MKKVVLIHALLIGLIVVLFFWQQGASLNEGSVVSEQGSSYEDLSYQGGVESVYSKGPSLARKALFFLAVGLYGLVVFIMYVLPRISDAFSRFIFSDSGNVSVEDALVKARSLREAGEYEEASKHYVFAAFQNPGDRAPIVERANLQKEQLHDSTAAADTYLKAMQKEEEWTDEDLEFFQEQLVILYQQGERLPSSSSSSSSSEGL